MRWISAILTLALFFCGPAFLNCQTLNLDDAIKAAEANNRLILAAELEKKKALDEVYAAKVLAYSSAVLVLGAFFAIRLHQQFFPRDNFYIAYVDIHLPEDAPLSETDRATREAERVIRDNTIDFRSSGEASVLASITSFIGGGGPRFWFSVTPEAPAPNYAQLLVQFTHSEDTNKLVGPLQEALSAKWQARGLMCDGRRRSTAVAKGKHEWLDILALSLAVH